MIVSEPPEDSHRNLWNSEKLADLGLVAEGRVCHGAAYQVQRKPHPTPNEYPRSIGAPRKRPLF
jgi:hypothetical protein